MAINRAKGAFGSDARIVIPQKGPIESTYYYQLYTSSKIGCKVVNGFSKFIFHLVVFGAKMRNYYKRSLLHHSLK